MLALQPNTRCGVALKKFSNCFMLLCPQIINPTINPSQKWWSIVLEIKFSCSQWEASTCTHDGPWFFLLVFLPCWISSPAISLGQKWWPTVLETKNICSQWVGWNMHSRCLDFFLSFGWGGWGRIFSIFPLSPTCSFYVPFKFPMDSHKFFICF